LARHLDIFAPVGVNYVDSREAGDGSVLSSKTGPKRPVLSLFGGVRRPAEHYCYIGLITRRFMFKSDIKKARKALENIHQQYLLKAMQDHDKEYILAMNGMFALLTRLEKEVE